MRKQLHGRHLIFFRIQQDTGKTARSSSELCIHHCASLSSRPRAKLGERSSRPFSVQRQKTCVRHDVWDMGMILLWIGSNFSIDLAVFTLLAYGLWRDFSHSTHIVSPKNIVLTHCWKALAASALSHVSDQPYPKTQQDWLNGKVELYQVWSKKRWRNCPWP